MERLYIEFGGKGIWFKEYDKILEYIIVKDIDFFRMFLKIVIVC